MTLIVIAMNSDRNIGQKKGRPLSFNRDAALEKAMLTFWRYGYETTSISDLTAAMDVTPPSIYAAYGDKKQLFLEAARLYAGPPEDLDRLLFDAKTARDGAYAMLVASAEAFTGKETPPGCLLASAAASGSKASADVQAAIADIRRNIQNRLVRRIKLDIDQGVLPAAADTSSLAAMVIALIQGMSVLARDGVERSVLLGVIEAAMKAWPQAAGSSAETDKGDRPPSGSGPPPVAKG